MNRAKCSSSCKDGSNQSRIITGCNRGRNLIGNQLTQRSNPRKSNINRTFRRAKWHYVIPKLINSSVHRVNNNFLRIPITQFLICSNSLLIPLSEQILRALNVRHLIRLIFQDLRANTSQLKYQPVNVGFLYILVMKAKEHLSTNTSKNGN